ncbi:MAG: mycofactocin biosynthesis glycosyltransferase MftF [Ilumatobacteraceae bacterium]
MPTIRYRLDRTWRRPGDGSVIIAGSPLRLFRLSAGGARVAAQLEAGAPPDTAAVREFIDRFVDAGALHPLPDASEFRLNDVTVVMPHWSPDSGRLTAEVPSGVAVIVVDDASPGWAAPMPEGPALRVLRRDANGGPAAARNTGLAEVRTPLVAFVDTDVVLPDSAHEWLTPLLAQFADPRVAIVAPRVASRADIGSVAAYEQRHSPIDMGDEPARVSPGTRVGYIPSAVMVCRTAAVRDLGGFDEGLRFGEDVDLVWRAVAAGHRVRYEPSVVVHHRPRSRWADVLRQRVGYGRSAAPLAARHHAAVAPVRASAWSLAVWLLVAMRRPGVGAALAAGTAIALRRRLAALPAADALRLALTGHLHAGRQLASAVRRVWWPLAAVAWLVSRRSRPLIAAAFVLSETIEAIRLRSTRPVRDLPAAIADDLAYGYGVWAGVAATGEVGALLPDVSPWPPRDRR